jgi:MYXO-CTERM domain-containing protein
MDPREATMTKPSAVLKCLVVAALNFCAFSVHGAPAAATPAGGDAEAQKLANQAMEVDYLKMNFDAAKKKLSQAALACRRKGCSSGLHASIHGYFAIIHWLGEDSPEMANDDLKNMLKIDPEQKLDVRYSNEELEEAWETKQADARKVAAEERRVIAAREAEERKIAAAREAEERKAAAAREAEERRQTGLRAAAEAKKAEDERKAATIKAEADRKAAALKAEEDKKIAAAKAAEERRVIASKQAEINKQQAIKDAEEKLARDAARHADEERAALESQKAENARRAAEEAKRVEEEKKELARKADEDRKRLEADRREAARRTAEEKKEAAKRAADEKKEAAQRAADDAKRAAEEKREAAKRAEEEKKAAALKVVEDAKRAAEEKREAARKAEEDRKEAAQRAADDAKRAAEEKREAARKAEEDRKEAARKAEEDRKEAARKAEEEKKEAAFKAAEEAKHAAEEKKEAARKAAEEKKEAAFKAAEEAKRAAEEKKEAARKAEEDRKKAEEERRLRVPPPVGKLVENPFKEQAVGYPIPIVVKIPPAPSKIEKPRVEVVKVVAEYSAPGVAGTKQVELKASKEGEWIGELPCEVTAKDGEVTYFTSAYNKFDNAVARSGSTAKPNKVAVKSELVSSLPHWPGELPPESCATMQSKAKAIAEAKCASTEQGCNNAPPPLCEGNECGGDDVPAALAANQPKRFGACVGCRVGGETDDPAWMPVAGALLGLAVARRSTRRRHKMR